VAGLHRGAVSTKALRNSAGRHGKKKRTPWLVRPAKLFAGLRTKTRLADRPARKKYSACADLLKKYSDDGATRVRIPNGTSDLRAGRVGLWTADVRAPVPGDRRRKVRTRHLRHQHVHLDTSCQFGGFKQSVFLAIGRGVRVRGLSEITSKLQFDGRGAGSCRTLEPLRNRS